MDACTLYQLRNMINQGNVPRDPSTNVSESKDFFLTVVDIHILSACMKVFEMTLLDSCPSEKLFPHDFETANTLHRRSILLEAVNSVIDKYVFFEMEEGERKDEQEGAKDHVCEYACDVLTLGLM